MNEYIFICTSMTTWQIIIICHKYNIWRYRKQSFWQFLSMNVRQSSTLKESVDYNERMYVKWKKALIVTWTRTVSISTFVRSSYIILICVNADYIYILPDLLSNKYVRISADRILPCLLVRVFLFVTINTLIKVIL